MQFQRSLRCWLDGLAKTMRGRCQPHHPRANQGRLLPLRLPRSFRPAGLHRLKICPVHRCDYTLKVRKTSEPFNLKIPPDGCPGNGPAGLPLAAQIPVGPPVVSFNVTKLRWFEPFGDRLLVMPVSGDQPTGIRVSHCPQQRGNYFFVTASTYFSALRSSSLTRPDTMARKVLSRELIDLRASSRLKGTSSPLFFTPFQSFRQTSARQSWVS